MSKLRELQVQVKNRTEERRRVIYWDIVREVFSHCESPDPPNLTRGRDQSQIFVLGFQFNDNQRALDRVHEVVRQVKNHFGEELIRIDYRYGARTKWKHHVGPPTDLLIKEVDGDRDYVTVSIRLTDPDY